MISSFFPFMDGETSSERQVYFSRLHSPGVCLQSPRTDPLACTWLPALFPEAYCLMVPGVWQKMSPTSIQCPLRSLFSENSIELWFSVRERTACPRLFSPPETFHFLQCNDLLPFPYNSTRFRHWQRAATWFFKIYFSECERNTRKLETSAKWKTWKSVKNNIKHPNTPKTVPLTFLCISFRQAQLHILGNPYMVTW